MPKHSSPLVGFNNNVKHRGRIFHVQTEDSGVSRPRIVTHLFADGGRIIKSTKTDYSEHVGRKDMVVVVRRLMKEQHKAMFIALRDGQFDDAISDACVTPVPDAAAKSSAPRAVERPPTLPEIPRGGPAADASRSGAPPPVPRRPAPTLTDVSLADVGAPSEHVRTSVSAVTVQVSQPSEVPAERDSAVDPKGTPVLGTPAMRSHQRRTVSGRYAAPRPAAIFSEKSPADGGSIFGGSSISEQSLDEVILSYLAEDLDGAPPDD